MKKLTIFLAFLLFVGFTVQAQMQISGTVTGAEDGLSIPGVSVVVKDNLTIGTTTDMDGKYSLTVPSEAEALVFSFVGMKTQEVVIGGRSVIDVQMESEVLQMDEVVVTAIGIKREKREITYQTQKVVDDELTKVAPTRAAQGLAGKVAGMQINVQDNGVNPNSQILLRGVRSITANNEALIVIDGSIATSAAFDDLNPNDIADLSVLKGATAAALYGSQAGNGALIVTTKSGKGADKFTVGINSSYTMEKVAYMPDFQTEYGTGWEGAYNPVENTNWGPRFDGQMRLIGPDFPDDYPVEDQIVPYAPVEDNLLDFFQTGNSLQNTVYMTGSTEDSKFYLSFGDQRTSGIVPEDTYERNTLRVNASKKIGKVEVGVNASFLTDETDVVGSTIGDQDRPLYWFILNTSANVPLSEYSDWDNPLSYGYADNYQNAYYQNPYWAIGTNRNMDKTNRLVANVSLSYDVLEWLNFTGRVSANNVWGNGKNWRAAQTYDPDLQPAAGAVSSFVEDYEFKRETYTTDALFTGNFDFYDAFTLKTIVGGSMYSDQQRESEYRGNNLSIPNFYELSNATGSLEGGLVGGAYVDEYQKRTIGLFGDFTLGYNNYLFLNFSGRNDWTSTLPKDGRSYFYPAVGLSFVATDAFEVLKTGDILTFAKITASNSTVYNDLAPYQVTERFYQENGFPYGPQNGFYLGRTTVDESISKEKLNTTEVGLNLGFLNGRIFLDFAWFKTMIQDNIVYTTPSNASGATSYLTNIGELESTGYEFSITGKLINAKDLKWDINLNYFSNETVVNEIKEGLDEVAVYSTGQFGVYAVVGEAYPQIKTNIYERDPQGRIVVDPVSGHPQTKEGLYNMGKATPDYIMGLSSVLSYKGFSLSGTIDYRTGHVYYEEGSDAMEFTGRSMASVSANRQDFVIPNTVIETSPGVYVENTNIPVQGGRQSYWTDIYNEVSENYVKDATALKVRELSVNYELPKSILGKTPLKKVVVGFIARNPWTWLPEENRFSDPEFKNQTDRGGNVTGANAIGIGGYMQSPPTKSYGFSLNIEF
ncbi:MAG: SusC/RagA family TonB-linked outer membrane protein [Bacteroidetes bacterium]|nr:SusC/RagA family TonB-linked outer membrane protein [Bacteroidota bacterium]